MMMLNIYIYIYVQLSMRVYKLLHVCHYDFLLMTIIIILHGINMYYIRL